MHFEVKGWSLKIDIYIFEEPENQRLLADDKVPKKNDFYQESCLHGHAGVHFYVKGWSPKIYRHIFEKLENSPKFWSSLFCPKSIFQN